MGADFMSTEAQRNVTRSSAARVREHGKRKRRCQQLVSICFDGCEMSSFRCSTSGSLAKFAAMRRASSRVSRLVGERPLLSLDRQPAHASSLDDSQAK
jgi:hypothetical protein